jgi:hypothetical protein
MNCPMAAGKTKSANARIKIALYLDYGLINKIEISVRRRFEPVKKDSLRPRREPLTDGKRGHGET